MMDPNSMQFVAFSLIKMVQRKYPIAPVRLILLTLIEKVMTARTHDERSSRFWLIMSKLTWR